MSVCGTDDYVFLNEAFLGSETMYVARRLLLGLPIVPQLNMRTDLPIPTASVLSGITAGTPIPLRYPFES